MKLFFFLSNLIPRLRSGIESKKPSPQPMEQALDLKAGVRKTTVSVLSSALREMNLSGARGSEGSLSAEKDTVNAATAPDARVFTVPLVPHSSMFFALA
jgi:hypothetical protein